jgi:ankyrin repeat protein
MDIMIDLIHFSRVPVSTLVDAEGRCPFLYACGEGHLSVCQWLIEHGGVDYHQQDDRGRSCLIYACRSGHVELVEWLLPIVSPQSTNTGWHPIHFACCGGYLNIVNILLRYDKKCGQTLTNTGHSALFMAMHSTTNTVEMVKCLLDSHSSVQLTSQDIQDLHCDKSLILLLAQRRHSLVYLLQLLERIDYPFELIHLLLLSEHIYCSQHLLSIPHHQSFIRHHLQNPRKLKQITRCLIRKSIDTSNKIDLLEINQNLKKFLRFEYLY